MKALAAILRWLLLLAAAAFAAAAPLAALPLPAGLNPLLLLFGTLFFGEWGHLLAAGPALIALGAFLLRRGHRRVAGATLLLCLAGAGLLLTPAAEAWGLGRSLPSRLEAAFGPAAVADRPFSALRLYAARPEAIGPERLRYGQKRLPLDFYRAQGRSPAPCVLVLHGGGWSLGGRGECRPFDAWLARRGYAVAAIEYTLAPPRPVPAAFRSAADYLRPTAENRALPHAPWPASRDDVLAAIQYLRRGAAELGIDPERIVLLGRSAGGQLAEAAGYSRADPGIRGVIGI